MRLVLDHCVPRQFARELPGHEVRTAKAMGWATLGNGLLMQAAADAGFDALITVDRNLSFQHNHATLPLAVIALMAPDNKATTLAPLAGPVLLLLAEGVARRVYVVRSQR